MTDLMVNGKKVIGWALGNNMFSKPTDNRNTIYLTKGTRYLAFPNLIGKTVNVTAKSTTQWDSNTNNNVPKDGVLNTIATFFNNSAEIEDVSITNVNNNLYLWVKAYCSDVSGYFWYGVNHKMSIDGINIVDQNGGGK